MVRQAHHPEQSRRTNSNAETHASDRRDRNQKVLNRFLPPHQERGKLRRNDRETRPIEFGMKNLGLRIYVPGGKYKGIEAQGIRV